MSLTLSSITSTVKSTLTLLDNEKDQALQNALVDVENTYQPIINFEQLLATYLLQIYPVSSIYMSTSSANPSMLFGGVWEQIQDRFLLGAGSSYANGSTGGAATVELSVAQLPSHTHDAPQGDASVDDYVFQVSRTNSTAATLRQQVATSTSSGIYVNAANIKASDSIGTNDVNASNATKSTKATGGNASHDNMPPYLVVYMWKRVG